MDAFRFALPILRGAVATHEHGLAIAERYGFSIDDSLIIAAALLAGCELIWTEDLQDGQRIEDQLTVKPRRSSFVSSKSRTLGAARRP